MSFRGVSTGITQRAGRWICEIQNIRAPVVFMVMAMTTRRELLMMSPAAALAAFAVPAWRRPLFKRAPAFTDAAATRMHSGR